MGKKKAIRMEDASLIYQCYLDSPKHAALELAFSMGYGKSSYYKIIKNKGVITNNYNNSFRKKTWTEDQIEEVIKYIENENPQARLDEIIEKFVNQQGFPNICASTLWNYIDGALMKTTFFNNTLINTDQVKLGRKEFVEWFQVNCDMNNFFYISECSFKLYTIRRHIKPYHDNNKDKMQLMEKETNQICVCMCLNKDNGLVKHLELKNNISDEEFLKFIGSIIETVKMSNIVLVLDHYRRNIQNEIEQLCSRMNWNYIFLPPCSAMLNIVSSAFDALKSEIKLQIEGAYKEKFQDISKALFGQKEYQRTLLLEEILMNSMSIISQEKVLEFWNQMIAILPKIINLDDF